MRVLLVMNPRHAQAPGLALEAAGRLRDAGAEVVVAKDDLEALRAAGASAEATGAWRVVDPDESAAAGCDLVLVLGGDGTILRGAERAHGAGVPLLGVNLGHVGFLAEAEPEAIAPVVDAVLERRWTVEERLALDIRVMAGGAETARTWALNEASIEKLARERMIGVVVEIDGRPLSTWGCDGVVAATPTGSTAYAFSAGGPVVWPEVQALLVVPLSAHALFARPLVVAPTSTIALELQPGADALLAADGRRMIDIAGGSRIEVRRHAEPVRIARLLDAPFTDRLVRKFDLPVEGWRGRPGRPGHAERSR